MLFAPLSFLFKNFLTPIYIRYIPNSKTIKAIPQHTVVKIRPSITGILPRTDTIDTRLSLRIAIMTPVNPARKKSKLTAFGFNGPLVERSNPVPIKAGKLTNKFLPTLLSGTLAK